MAINFSDRIFTNLLSKNEQFLEDIRKDLIGANMPILARNYISRMIFFTLLSGIIGIIFGIGIFIFLKNLIISIAVIFFLPLIVFSLFYVYPSSVKNSIGKKIDEELPFVTIYMAAISSSDLESLAMFRLLANSKEYPTTKLEMRRVINQIDLYGYNLATALVNVARDTQSEKLAELYSGIAANITSGGSLKNYLEKKAENLLVDYKLDRQKYNSLAETFMNIYISLLITAPLILMIVFIVMKMSGFGVNIPEMIMNLFVIIIIILLNIIFLIVLHFKQPRN